MKKYIIEIINSDKPSYYIRGNGDPNRTTMIEYAQIFNYVESAYRAKRKLEAKYPHREYSVRTVRIDVTVLI